MNNKDKSSKTTLIIIIVIVILAVGYYFYTSGDSASTVDPNSSLVTMQDPNFNETQVVGARVLSLLNQISSLKIDASLFEGATYKSLVDYTISIPEQNVGRPNPFAPLPGYVPPSSSRTTTRGR